MLRLRRPRERELPKRLVADAERAGLPAGPGRRPAAGGAAWASGRCGFATSSSGWRCGPGTGGRSACRDLEAMVADTSEEAIWTLADAIIEGDAATDAAVRRAARRPGRGADAAHLLGWRHGCGRRTDGARGARGRQAAEGGGRRALDAPLRGEDAGLAASAARSPAELDRRSGAIADLEWWSRGGSDYREDVALTLALSAACRSSRGLGRSAAPALARLELRSAFACDSARYPAGAGSPRRARRGSSCGRRCSCAARPSGPPCRSARSSRCARLGDRVVVARGRRPSRAAGSASSTALAEAQVLHAAHARCGRCASSVRRCWPSGPTGGE